MWLHIGHTSHRGQWRQTHAHRTAGERLGNYLWWAVVGATVLGATLYTVHLFQ